MGAVRGTGLRRRLRQRTPLHLLQHQPLLAPSWPAALIAMTKRMQIGVIGHVLPLRHPVQTAEEFAQTGCPLRRPLHRGRGPRRPSGVRLLQRRPLHQPRALRRVRSTSCNEVLSLRNFSTTRADFYNLKAVSVWPQADLQDPLPIWMPAGSAETIEFAARHRLPIARVWNPT